MTSANELPLSLLTATPLPEMAAALRSSLAPILERWEHVVRETLPKADELTFTQLRDDMPQVLEQVALALEHEGVRHVNKLLDVTNAHGSVRYRQQYNLSELLVEYDLLRPILIEHVMMKLRRRLTIEEAVALITGLDVCTRRSTLTFVEEQSSELKAATEAQSKYLSFLSHDLRGGLNGVFLMIEVLKREIAGEERLAQTMEDLDAMRRTLLETVGTMDRFLHAERFRKGKVQVQPMRINLKSLLSEIAAHFSYQAREKGISVQVAAADDYILNSDRDLLTLIFQNLLSNAMKYGGKGTVQIKAVPSEGGYLASVKDDGPGIAPDRLGALFAPFTRGQTYGQPGVGLGLSIARQAADLLSSRLWAESEPGHGSTFYVQLNKDIVPRT